MLGSQYTQPIDAELMDASFSRVPLSDLSRVIRRRTQIVATIGPACRDESTLYSLIVAGMDVGRLHFAYASEAEHAVNIARIRNAAALASRKVAILQDLPGTKVRIGELPREQVVLEEGDSFVLWTGHGEGEAMGATLNFPELVDVVGTEDLVLLADGALRLRVTNVDDSGIRCRVERGGELKSHQAVHVSGRDLHLPVPTSQDKQHALFGLSRGVDWIAQSFVKEAEEIDELRAFVQQNGGDVPIIAKIERQEAFKNLDSIVRAADGVMVARGDLGIQFPIEDIALLQKEIIRRANHHGRPVITATEMLSSMIERPYPTRAEVTDITNAILDGTDAIMLSGETGVGRFPLAALQMAYKVAGRADSHLLHEVFHSASS